MASALLMAVILVVVYTSRIKRFEWTCHRWHCWSEYFLFVLYLRRFYESSAFFSTHFTDGALLSNLWLYWVYHFCWDFDYRIYFSREVC